MEHGKKKKLLMRRKLEKRNLFPNKIKLKTQFILLDNISVKKCPEKGCYSNLKFALHFCLLISKILCSFILSDSGMVNQSA